MKHILVTGATGFIGQHLIRSLLKQGFKVTALAKEADQRKQRNLAIYNVDITQAEQFDALPSSIDGVIHTAALIPPNNDPMLNAACFAVNVNGTYNVLSYAVKSHAKRFIYASSMSVYDVVKKGKITESYQANPKSIYGLTKKLGEDVVMYFSSVHKLPSVILRYPSVYGPGMLPTTIIPLLLNRAKNSHTIAINGTGKRTQDFVYVDDVVQANMLAIQSDATGLYLIGSGKQTSLTKLANTIKQVLPETAIAYDNTKQDDPQRLCFDYTKAAKAFHYQPRWNLVDGIKQLL